MSSGFKVVVVKSDEQGNVDVKDLWAYTGMLPTLSHLMKDSDPEVLCILTPFTPYTTLHRAPPREYWKYLGQ